MNWNPMVMKDLKERVCFVPLDTETRFVYRECVKKALYSNTLLVMADPFFRAKASSILAYNFYRLFPSCSIICLNIDAELPTFLSVFAESGIPKHQLKPIVAKKGWEKALTGGVIFISAKSFISFLSSAQPNILETFQVKLIIINEAQKAVGHNVLTKIVRQVMNVQEGAFRVFGLSEFVDTKKVSSMQSVISNLCLSTVLVRSIGSLEIENGIFPRTAKVTRLKFVTNSENFHSEFVEHLNAWKKGVEFIMKPLDLAELPIESNIDALLFSDFDSWEKNLSRCKKYVNNLAKIVRICKTLIIGYRNLCLYGYRAFYLFLQAMRNTDGLLETIQENSNLNHVFSFVNAKYDFPYVIDTCPTRFTALNNSHPKMATLLSLLREIQLKNPDYKIIVFVDSCFGARAFAEMCASAPDNFQLLENCSKLDELLINAKTLRGNIPQDKKWICDKFRMSDIPLLFSSKSADNLGSYKFDCVIATDYFTSSLRYLQFGRQHHAILMEPFENISADAFTYDSDMVHPRSKMQPNFNRTCYRMEQSLPIFGETTLDGTSADCIFIEYLAQSYKENEKAEKKFSSSTEKLVTQQSHNDTSHLTNILHQQLLNNNEESELKEYFDLYSIDFDIKKSMNDGLKEHFIYDPNPVAELCDYDPLIGVELFAPNNFENVVEHNGNNDLVKTLCEQFMSTRRFVSDLQTLTEMEVLGNENMTSASVKRTKIIRDKSHEIGFEELGNISENFNNALSEINMVVPKGKYRNESYSNNKGCLKITDHFKPIRPLCDDDFSFSMMTGSAYKTRCCVLEKIISMLDKI